MHFHTCKLPAIYYIISCCSGVAGIYDIPFNDAGSLNAKRVEPIEKFSWPSGRSVTLSVFDPDSDPLATTAKKASFCDKNAASYDMNNNDSTQLWIPPTDSSLQELRSFIFQHEGHIFDCLLSKTELIYLQESLRACEFYNGQVLQERISSVTAVYCDSTLKSGSIAIGDKLSFNFSKKLHDDLNNKRLQDIVSEVQFELVKTEKRTPGVIDDPESFWKQKNTTTIASVPSYWDLLLITMKREWQFGSKLSNLEGALVGTETGNREPFALSQLEQRPVVPTSAPRTWNNHLKQPPKVKYIELLLINDYARWQQFGGHLIDLELNTLAIVSAAQHVFDRALFQGFRIRLVVHTILNEEKEERFCGDDRVTVSANRLLESFCDWHSTQDAGIRPVWDNAHLLSGRLFLGSEESKNWSDKETKAAPDLDAGNTIEGLSYVRGMCTASSSCSVVRASVYQEVRNIGLVLAHEIAHNLDAIHDGPDNGCPPYGHVMQATSCAFCQDLADSWSSCSIAAIGAFLNSDASQCLDNIPSLCGNGILDPGEACDSGMPNGSACCTPICQLKSGATCEDRNGSCCQNCTLLNAGTPCLSQQQEQGTLLSRQKLICQHPATCDGIHAACPILPLPQGSPCTLYPSDDVLLHTGQYPTVSLSPARRPDEPIQGVCLDGQCRTRERVCQQLGLSYSPKCDPLQSCSVICLEPNNKSKRQQTTNLSSNSTLTLAYATGGHCVAVSVQQLTGTTGPLAVPDFLSCKLDGRQPLNLGGHQFQSGLGVCHAGLCRPSDSPINTAESKPTHSQLQRITLLILIFLLFALVII